LRSLYRMQYIRLLLFYSVISVRHFPVCHFPVLQNPPLQIQLSRHGAMLHRPWPGEPVATRPSPQITLSRLVAITIICHESDRTTWWIREAVKIRQESQGVMNREGTLKSREWKHGSENRGRREIMESEYFSNLLLNVLNVHSECYCCIQRRAE